jgi:hypothetical protein
VPAAAKKEYTDSQYGGLHVKARPLTLILAVLILFTVSGAPLFADIVVYNNIPNPMPPASPSLGFQATQTAQFGDLIHLGTAFRLPIGVTQRL